jgi:hypothetical protein
MSTSTLLIFSFRKKRPTGGNRNNLDDFGFSSIHHTPANSHSLMRLNASLAKRFPSFSPGYFPVPQGLHLVLEVVRPRIRKILNEPHGTAKDTKQTFRVEIKRFSL